MPKKFRSQLKIDELVLTRGLDGCIWGFSLEGWQREVERYLKTPIEDKRSRIKRRMVFGGAEIVGLDKQGRFVVPEGLCEYAGIGQEIILVGIGDRFEIWSEKRWKRVALSGDLQE